MSQAFTSILQFIGRTFSTVRVAVRNAMTNRQDRGVANNAQNNVSFVDLRDEAQIVNRVPKKFGFSDTLQRFIELFSEDNPDADIAQDKFNISTTNPNGVNYSINTSEFRDMVGRSDGAATVSYTHLTLPTILLV